MRMSTQISRDFLPSVTSRVMRSRNLFTNFPQRSFSGLSFLHTAVIALAMVFCMVGHGSQASPAQLCHPASPSSTGPWATLAMGMRGADARGPQEQRLERQGPASTPSPKALAKAWSIGALDRRNFGPVRVSALVFCVENGAHSCQTHGRGSASVASRAQGLAGFPPTGGVWGDFGGGRSLQPWHVRF